MCPGGRRVRTAGSVATAFALLVVLIVGVTGCDVVRIKRGSLERHYFTIGMQHRAVAIDGAEMHFWEGGEGDPVLLLHGFGASGIWQWPGQAEELVHGGDCNVLRAGVDYHRRDVRRRKRARARKRARGR